MEETPLVSIIMNCYNSDRFLRDAIESVYTQTYPNWEIIFWDNASTDSSAAIAGSFDHRIKYHLASTTTPLGEARNLALACCQGKYVAFLDCDDQYLPHKLEQQVQLMESGEYALSYSSAIVIDHEGHEIRRGRVKNQSGELFGKLLNHYEINMQTVIIHRDVLEKENIQFNASMKYCPDHNMFMTIASRYKVGVISDYLVKYRVVDDSLSSKTIEVASSEVQLTLDEILERDPELKNRYKNDAKKAYNKLYYYDAVAALTVGSRSLAIEKISKVIFFRPQYFTLYILLHTPISDNYILRVLRR